MTVLDAYAVIAYLRGETAAGDVRPLLGEDAAEFTAVGLAESSITSSVWPALTRTKLFLTWPNSACSMRYQSPRASAALPAVSAPGTTTAPSARSAWPTA